MKWFMQRLAVVTYSGTVGTGPEKATTFSEQGQANRAIINRRQ